MVCEDVTSTCSELESTSERRTVSARELLTFVSTTPITKALMPTPVTDGELAPETEPVATNVKLLLSESTKLPN